MLEWLSGSFAHLQKILLIKVYSEISVLSLSQGVGKGENNPNPILLVMGVCNLSVFKWGNWNKPENVVV